MNKPKFDPSHSFEVLDKPRFDPSQPFESVETDNRSMARKVAEGVIDSPAFPIIGGVAGATGGGGLFSVPMAGFGAAGGEAWRQILARKMGMESPQSSREALGKINRQASMAMGGEVLGLVAKPILQSTAIPFARRALGLSKRFLNSTFARGQAQKAAKVALEENVIPFSGNPQQMMSRVENIASESGRKIGRTLEGIKFSDIAPEAEFRLESLKQLLTKGTKKGILADAGRLIDEVKDTILELYGRESTANSFNAIKTKIANSINYLVDNIESQGVKRSVASDLGSTVRQIVKKVVPDKFSDFISNQRLFNASSLMKKGLNNELAAQMGNRMLSPYSVISGASQLASGQPLTAPIVAGLAEAIFRRGSGIAARALYSGAKKMPLASRAALQAIFDKEKK